MKRSLAAIFVALLAAPFAQAATEKHFCTQPSITVNESERFVSVEMRRQRNLSEPSVGALVVYGSWQWFLPHGIHRVDFAPFQSRKTIRIPIDDAVYTGTQTTTIRCGAMRNNVPAPYESEVALTVLDDETPPKLTAPALLVVTETEEAQLIEIPFRSTHASAAAVTSACRRIRSRPTFPSTRACSSIPTRAQRSFACTFPATSSPRKIRT